MSSPQITLALQALQARLQDISTGNGYATPAVSVFRGRAALWIGPSPTEPVLTIYSTDDAAVDLTAGRLSNQGFSRRVIIEAKVPITDAWDDDLDRLLEDIRRALHSPITVDLLLGHAVQMQVGSVQFTPPESDVAGMAIPLTIDYLINFVET